MLLAGTSAPCTMRAPPPPPADVPADVPADGRPPLPRPTRAGRPPAERRAICSSPLTRLEAWLGFGLGLGSGLGLGLGLGVGLGVGV